MLGHPALQRAVSLPPGKDRRVAGPGGGPAWALRGVSRAGRCREDGGGEEDEAKPKRGVKCWRDSPL